MSAPKVPLSKYWEKIRLATGPFFTGSFLFQVATVPQSFFDNNFRRLDESSKRAATSIPQQAQQNAGHVRSQFPTQSPPIGNLTPAQSQALSHAISQAMFTLEKIFQLIPFILLGLSGILIFLVVVYYAFRSLLFRKDLSEDYEEQVFLSIKPPAKTLQSAFSTEQLLVVLAANTRQPSFWQKFFRKRQMLSLELVSTREEGIRYVIKTTKQDAGVLKKTLLSYLPSAAISEIKDYLTDRTNTPFETTLNVSLANHFAIPLQDQKTLSHHDPIAYITGQMTKLEKDELVAMQLVLTPVNPQTHKKIWKIIEKLSNRIWENLDIADILEDIPVRRRILYFVLNSLALAIYLICWELIIPLGIFRYLIGRSDSPIIGLPFGEKPKPVIKTLQQEELYRSIHQKIDTRLFETSIRFFIAVNSKQEKQERTKGFISSLSSFANQSIQGFTVKDRVITRLILLVDKIIHRNFSHTVSYFTFKHRLLAPLDFKLPFFSFSNNPILSLSEVADLYHLPHTDITKTENIVKVYAKELPAPQSLKGATNLDVIFAKNMYGGQETIIGLPKEDRRRHMYVIGQTGSGKTQLILTAISYDIAHRKGVAVIDPHGDLANSVQFFLPKDRWDDVIVFDPDDLAYPIRINLLELTPGLSDDDADREKEFVCESVISLFRKVFSNTIMGTVNPHRIEEILRNTIYTAFTVPNCTIFTVYDLLEDPEFREEVINKLEDGRLKKFWKNVFEKAGDYQQVKMISPVTARIGRFLFSPSAKRILEQPKSTIDFDKIMDEGKILICNLSRGKLGEDTSEVLGIMIMNKLQLAALKRARIPEGKRRDFYLYVDEFQYFATHSFIKMLSDARKYKLNIIMAEQTTSQQSDPNSVNILLANAGTVISFKSANPDDEKRILPQFAPYVEKGEILNLPAYHFYIKMGAMYPEEPFSGVTILIDMPKDYGQLELIRQVSRKNYATFYKKPKPAKKPVQKVKTNNKKGEKKSKNDLDDITLL